jgi:glycosyltransferase involved in cell wall biosynthesis
MAVPEPRITVLLPVKHYHRPFLERALRSIREQTSPDWRLLAITDAELLDELEDVLGPMLDDPRVELVRNEGRALAGKLNTGLRRARTDFVAVLLGDDFWAPETVEVLTEHVERFPEADFFHTGRVFVDDEERPISGVYEPKQTFALEDFANGSPVKHLLCYRRELALSIGGVDESLGLVGVDDWDFAWSMAEAGASFVAVPFPLYVYRDHRQAFRLTTHLTLRTHRRGIRRILRKHGVGRLRAFRLSHAPERNYLRQCLYRSPLDRFLKDRRGFDPRTGWRDAYRA